jgi:hypothetical protein
MEHRALDDIRRVAQVVPAEAMPTYRTALSRRERLARWAAVLEHADRPLKALMRVEFLPVEERPALRGDDTPLALAYADPVLREQGLTGDRLGDIMSFFELSHRDAHYLLCDCHFHGTMTSRSVAARVRSLLPRATFQELCARLWARMRGPLAAA